MKSYVIGLLSLLLCVTAPKLLLAATADLAIDSGSITFSTSKFYSGETVRIYARVRNLGEVDMQGSVVFYNGTKIVGATQPVSLRVGGAPEEVFVDFLIPDSSFNIYAVLAGSSPTDENSSNDSAMTVLYTAILDADKDGILDEVDNCRDDANADQADLDQDNIGDVCDSVDNTPKPIVVTPPVIESRPLTAAPAAAVTVVPAVTSAATIVTPSVVSSAVASTATASAMTNPTAVNIVPSDHESTIWPNKAYGIFDNVVAAESAALENSVSFWRLNNPAVQIMLIVLGLLAICCLLSMIIVRRKARHSFTETEIDEVIGVEPEV